MDRYHQKFKHVTNLASTGLLMILITMLSQPVSGVMECGRNYHLYTSGGRSASNGGQSDFSGGQSSVNGSQSDFIIGGTAARTGAWPSMAVIKYRNYIVCGAAVVKIPGQSARWLVTAAHCLSAIRKKEKTKIIVGITSQSDAGDTYAIDKVIPHPEFKRTRKCQLKGASYDIALIKVTEEISMKTAKVEWACMPRGKEMKILNDKSQVEGLMCHAIGFGIYKEGYRKHSKILQQLRVGKINECEDLYPDCYTKNQICWGEKGAQSCVGDSGAPLLCLMNGRWTVAGVCSRVMGRRCDEGALYVNLGDMASWIIETAKKN